MATALAKKLRIKEGDKLFPVNAPVGFKKKLGELPSNVKIIEDAEEANQLHWFVRVNKGWKNPSDRK
jgi:hypothetical protein